MNLIDKIKKLDTVITVLVSEDGKELNSYRIHVFPRGFEEPHDPSNDFRREVIERGFYITKLFANYYQGWECDEWSCQAVAVKDGIIYMISTSHGSLIEEEVGNKTER